jgi:phosphate transport system ATP-binding protein
MNQVNGQILPISVTTRSEIVTENLTLSYGKKIALRSINITLRSGSISAIIGPSGCGKSSFLNCLNRIIELTPNCQVSGHIFLDNCDIQTLNPIDLRRRVGMLFQKPTPFPLSILRNIEFPLQEHGIRDRHQLDEIIETTLQNVGLWNEVKDRLKSPALSLSGGQQQRLCLARALALNPEVLLMDEPCSALDPMSSEIVENLIVQLRGKYTIVVVTHNLSQSRRIADEVALFWLQDGAGTLIEMGAVDRMFNSPQHPLTQAYISGRKG